MTTACMDWQPVSHLEQENYLLREENRHLHFQVKELMEWKEKALKHMVAMGPKRNQAQQDVKQAIQLQRKLQAVEKTLQERAVLEQTTMTLQQENELLRQQIEMFETETRGVKDQYADTKDQLIKLAESFRLHLEQLVAIRTALEGEDDEEEDETRVTEKPTVHHTKDAENYDDPTLLVSVDTIGNHRLIFLF